MPSARFLRAELPVDLLEKLRERARLEGTTVDELIAAAVRADLDQMRKASKKMPAALRSRKSKGRAG